MNRFLHRFITPTAQLIVSAAVFIMLALPTQVLAATKYKIELEVSGEANAATKTEAFKSAPTMVQIAGASSTFKISAPDKTDRLRISTTVAEPEGDTVMVELKIEMRQTDGTYTNSSSRIKATLGTATSMALETDTGGEIELSLKVSKAP